MKTAATEAVQHGRFAPPLVHQRPARTVALAGSVEAFLDAVDAALAWQFYQPETRRQYASCLRRFFRWCGLLPGALTDNTVVGFFEELQHSGLSATRRSTYLCALRTVFDGLAGRRWTAALTLPVVARGERPALSGSDIDALFAALRGPRDRALAGMLYGLGLRPGEALRTRWTDVDWVAATLTVWPGPGRPARALPLPPPLLRALRAWRREQPPGRDNVFTAAASARVLSDRAVGTLLRVAAERAGIDRRINSTLLRLSGAVHLLQLGQPPAFVQRVLGYARQRNLAAAERAAVASASGGRSEWLVVEGDFSALDAGAEGDDEPIDEWPPTSDPAWAPEADNAAAMAASRVQLTVGAVHTETGEAVRVEVEALVPTRLYGGLPLNGVEMKVQPDGRCDVQLPTPSVWRRVLSWLPRLVQQRFRTASFLRNLTELVRQQCHPLLSAAG